MNHRNLQKKSSDDEVMQNFYSEKFINNVQKQDVLIFSCLFGMLLMMCKVRPIYKASRFC